MSTTSMRAVVAALSMLPVIAVAALPGAPGVEIVRKDAERRIDVIERPVDGVEPLPQFGRRRRAWPRRPGRQNAVIGTPSRHCGHEPASWFSGALYSASATLGT